MKVMLLALVMFALNIPSAEAGCGKRSCSGTEEVVFCGGTKAVSVSVKCNEKRGGGEYSVGYGEKRDLISCTVKKGSEVLAREQWEVSFPRCNGSCNGQTDPGPKQKDMMRSYYQTMVKSVASKDVGCDKVSQCEAFLRKDPDLFHFAGALSDDGVINSSEAQSISKAWKATALEQENKLGRARLPTPQDLKKGPLAGDKYPHQGFDEFENVSLNGTVAEFSFRREYFENGGPVDGSYDATKRVLRFESTNDSNGKRVVLTDSEGLSNVELRFVGNQCFPYKRTSVEKYSAVAPKSFDFSKCEQDAFNCEGLPYFAEYKSSLPTGTGKSTERRAPSAQKE